MSNARKGANFEREISNLLTDAGFSVIRGAGSKGFFDSPDGEVKPDLVASKRTHSNNYDLQIILIQCKTRKIQKSKPERVWVCPLGDRDCKQNCGNYGCGN
jgi:Holliday junction resolvase